MSHLLEALQQTSQRLAADLVDKTNQIDLLNSKLRAFNEDHAEEVQASRFQVMEQDKVIKALQAEAQQLKARLSPSRRDSACQPPPAPTPIHAACQAAPTTAEAALQAQPHPGCCAASQTEPTTAPGAAAGVGSDAADGEQKGGNRGSSAVHSQGTQTEAKAMEGVQGEQGQGMNLGAKWQNAADTALAVGGGAGAPKGGSSAHKVDASDACPSRDTLAFDLQVLTKKYERAIDQKVEAEEASLQAQLDVAQLIKLCEFYKSKAEAAMQASLQQHKAQASLGQGIPLSQDACGTHAQQQVPRSSKAQAQQRQQQQQPQNNGAPAQQQQLHNNNGQAQAQLQGSGAQAQHQLPQTGTAHAHQQLQGSGTHANQQQPQDSGAHEHQQLHGSGAQTQQQPQTSVAHAHQQSYGSGAQTQQELPQTSTSHAQQQLQGVGVQTQQQPQGIVAHAHQLQSGGAQVLHQLPQSSGARAQQHQAITCAAPVAGTQVQQQQQQQQQAFNPSPVSPQGKQQLSPTSGQSTCAQDMAPSAPAQGGLLHPAPCSHPGDQDGAKDLQGNCWHPLQESALPAHNGEVLESSTNGLQGGPRSDRAQHGVSPGANATQVGIIPCASALQGSEDAQGQAGGDRGECLEGDPLVGASVYLQTQHQHHSGVLSQDGPSSTENAAVHKAWQTRSS